MAVETYFVAGTGADGTQLWTVTVSGQTVTTAEVAELYAAPAVVADPNHPGSYILGTVGENSDPAQFTNFGGGTLFVASGLHTGRELFFTDGTAAGTHLVEDFTPAFDTTPAHKHKISYNTYSNAVSSDPVGITAVGHDLAVFTAGNGTRPATLYATNGTAAGTTALTTDGLYAASYITAFGSDALFAGSSPANGGTQQLWITDGTAAGTHAISGPNYPGLSNPAAANPAAGGFTVVATAAGGVEAFFAGTTTANATQLWATDGTDAGTHLVKTINTTTYLGQPVSASPSYITALGIGRAILVANDGVNGNQLWVTDGTAGGTDLVTVIGTAGASANPFADGRGFKGFTVATIDGKPEVVFNAYDNANGESDPWISDGTATETHALLSYSSAYARDFTAFDGSVFFAANDGTHGEELWVTDGTTAGTRMFDDINPGAGDSTPSSLEVLGNELFFMADAGTGATLWESDGTLAGTHAVTGASAVDISTIATQAIPCFALGTRIATERGDVAVEDLVVGDIVLAHFAGAAPIEWIGRSRVDCRTHARPEQVIPVRVRAGALAPGVPARDVLLSPGHAVFANGVLIPVGHLVNGVTILREEQVGLVTYFHIETAPHDVLLADGLPAESYLDDGNRNTFANAAAHRMLRPDHVTRDWDQACAPKREGGAELAAVQRQLRARFEPLGYRAAAKSWEVVAGQTRLTAPFGGRDVAHVWLPAGTDTVRLRSPRGLPVAVLDGSNDTRWLGIRLASVRLDGETIALDSPVLSDGFYGLEREGDACWRWTNGDAVLRVACSTAARHLELTIQDVMSGWELPTPGINAIAA